MLHSDCAVVALTLKPFTQTGQVKLEAEAADVGEMQKEADAAPNLPLPPPSDGSAQVAKEAEAKATKALAGAAPEKPKGGSVRDGPLPRAAEKWWEVGGKTGAAHFAASTKEINLV
eukprot:1182629-Prorocentrum_minimum.AAC.2